MHEKDLPQLPTQFPPQHQKQQPGIESLMVPKPIIENPNYKAAGKLINKVAIITGGDSGIGAATAIAFAKEGADVVIPYYYHYEGMQIARNGVLRSWAGNVTSLWGICGTSSIVKM